MNNRGLTSQWLVALWVLAGVLAQTICGLRAATNETWWSLRPITRPVVPKVEAGSENPIDSFLMAKLRERGLGFSVEADRRTLVRRVFIDLIGLPATPEEVRAFVDDERADAYERMVDRLLSSPRYGERWARHWLDVVHYGDTHGYDKDQPRPHAWRYRDYVIRAFNDDIPYSRFIEEQLAGDVLGEEGEAMAALGFISAGPWDLIGHAELPETKVDGKIARHLDRDDMVANTMSTFTSMTVHCAQCHDHKFDPISAEDYYSLQAAFAAVDRTEVEFYRDRGLTKKRQEIRRRERTLERERKELEAALKEAAGEDPETRLCETTSKISDVRAALAEMPKPELAFVGAVHHGSGSFRGTGPDDGKARAVHLLARGDVRKPGREVSPGALSAVAGLTARFDLSEGASESERRVALAKWLSDPRNPLTWRSMVNRVWQYHFGRGIVDTANDFGKMGSLPSHPELLDWLAVEFRDGEQSLKALHRLIVMSRAYRQSSRVENEVAEEVDGENRLLWRMNRRKLEAEVIRDAALQVSGRLNLEMYGPAFQDFVIEKPEHSPHYQYHLHDHEDRRSDRRSIYRFIVRSQQQPFMTALDCADPSISVEKRNQGLSSLQALALLNNGFMISMSKSFAGRLTTEASMVEGQITRAYELALARSPSELELRELADYTRAHGLPNTCRLIFNLNEFVFAD
ncbi:MAG TPA: DUF1549 and DUF1553 domain-containing protein [Verrucomicrobiae bacterium]